MENDKYILAYLLRVGENGQQYQGYFAEVENSLKAEQKFVDGLIAVVHLTDEIDVIYGDESLIQGKLLNRALYDFKGNFITAFLGNIMVVRHKGDCFVSIRYEDKEIIEKCLKPIERIFAGQVFLANEASLLAWEG